MQCAESFALLKMGCVSEDNELESVFTQGDISSVNKIRETAIEMHDCLREIKVIEPHKPIFIAGILIALSDENFCKTYANLSSFKMIMLSAQSAVENVLENNGIKSGKGLYIKQVFKALQDNTKFAAIPLVIVGNSIERHQKT